MSLAHDSRVALQPATMAQRPARTWPEINHPAAWIVALILVIMPLIASGFFLIEIFASTLILGTMALSLMFLAGYGGMVSLMRSPSPASRPTWSRVFGVSGNANISLGWPWWLAVPMALALATAFGTLGGALAVRTEGIYTIMITLAIGAAFYYFTNQNWAIFNGHTGINTVATPHFWGVNWRADIPFYYIVLAVAALCYFAVEYLSRARPSDLRFKACATIRGAWQRSASTSTRTASPPMRSPPSWPRSRACSRSGTTARSPQARSASAPASTC